MGLPIQKIKNWLNKHKHEILGTRPAAQLTANIELLEKYVKGSVISPIKWIKDFGQTIGKVNYDGTIYNRSGFLCKYKKKTFFMTSYDNNHIGSFCLCSGDGASYKIKNDEIHKCKNINVIFSRLPNPTEEKTAE